MEKRPSQPSFFNAVLRSNNCHQDEVLAIALSFSGKRLSLYH
ncbi:MAG: hypothetical protein PVG51_17345 [Desulfosarcina sp.]